MHQNRMSMAALSLFAAVALPAASARAQLIPNPVTGLGFTNAGFPATSPGTVGLYYANRGEFVEALRLLMTNSRLRKRLGENGRSYIRQNFRWDAVLGRFDRLVARARAK